MISRKIVIKISPVKILPWPISIPPWDTDTLPSLT
jgi:hypothetical protein